MSKREPEVIGVMLLALLLKPTTTTMCNGLFSDESREDLFSLLAFLDSWSFQIVSPEHSLCDVGQWLQEELGCEVVEGSPQYLLSNPAGPSAALVFHWQKKSPFLGELIIYCRCSLLLEKWWSESVVL